MTVPKQSERYDGTSFTLITKGDLVQDPKEARRS